MTTEVENPWGQINHKLVDLKIKHAEKELIEDANRRWAENSLPLTTPGGLTQPEWEAWLSNPSRLGDKETVSRLADIWFELLEGRTRTRQRVYGEECQRQGCAETGGFSKKVLDCNLVSLFSSSDKEFTERLEDYVKIRNVDKDLLRMGIARYRQKVSNFHTQVEEEIEIQVQEEISAAPTKEEEREVSSKTSLEKRREWRMKNAAQIIAEVKNLQAEMNDESCYDILKNKYPKYLTFEIAEKNPPLKDSLRTIAGYRAINKLALEFAAKYCRVEVSTMRVEWDHYKPAEYRTHRKRKHPSRRSKLQGLGA